MPSTIKPMAINTALKMSVPEQAKGFLSAMNINQKKQLNGGIPLPKSGAIFRVNQLQIPHLNK
jgi:hypothetical protein